MFKVAFHSNDLQETNHYRKEKEKEKEIQVFKICMSIYAIVINEAAVTN